MPKIKFNDEKISTRNQEIISKLPDDVKQEIIRAYNDTISLIPPIKIGAKVWDAREQKLIGVWGMEIDRLDDYIGALEIGAYEHMQRGIELDYKAIGQRAKVMREQAGLTLWDAANQLEQRGITPTHLKDLEEKGEPLQAMVLIKLALVVFQCKICDFLYGPSEIAPESKFEPLSS